MDALDLNLLNALDMLLAEGSVIGAARRLGLSSSAMSRTLMRLRRATGDPLLVRAGRRLVPTPHATALRDRVHSLTLDVKSVLRPSSTHLNLSALNLTFSIRAREWFVDLLSSAIVADITKAAPNVRLRFLPKRDTDPDLLRDGLVDLEIGKRGTSAPEIRTHFLFRDKYIGIARRGHPLLAHGKVTARRYSSCRHVVASQTGELSDDMDAALTNVQLSRTVQVVVPGFVDAARIAANSDLITLVPRASLGNGLIKDRIVGRKIQQFELPVSLPEILISALWHPRMDADPAQRWLRNAVISLCKRAYAAT